MMLLNYPSKKSLREAIGKPLRYTETSMFGAEYRANGTITGAHRPLVDGSKGREFFATVTMRDGLISGVR